jgi:hypothetical protein
MATIQFFRETSLPSTLVADAIYFIAPAGSPAGYMEIYVVNSVGTASRHTPLKSEIDSWIASAVGSANDLTIVNDIAARNALLPLTTAKWVYVIDATADSTVTVGGATYLYNPAGAGSWVKSSEAESMDVILSWANITGKPTSAVADIDDAVAKRHTHTNITQLNKIGEDAGGNMTYNGSLVSTGWTSTNW